jgi:signal peptidase II
MRALAVLPYAGIALGCVVADQFVKRLIVDAMHLHERIEVLPFFSLFHTRNTGVAFSFLSGFDDRVMVAVTAVVTVFIAWLAWRTEPWQVAARLGFALIIGGAAGNLIDRALLGYVIDYVLLHAGDWSFAVFNLADAFITVGAILVILQELIDWRRGPSPAG